MPCAPIPDQPVLFPRTSSSQQEIHSQYSHFDCAFSVSQPHVGAPLAQMTLFQSWFCVLCDSDKWLPILCRAYSTDTCLSDGKEIYFPLLLHCHMSGNCCSFLPCVFLLAAGTQVYEPGGGDCSVHNPGPGDGEAGQIQRSREVSFSQYWYQFKTEP